MSVIEKYRYVLISFLAVLSIATFVGLKNPAPAPSTSDLEQNSGAVNDETTLGNCGKCRSYSGSMVDCYKPTQRYTCASKASACATICQ